MMNMETRNNTQENARPPLPPAAVFDEQHLAEARPVQQLGKRQSRRLAAFQYIAGRPFAAIAPIIAGIIICVGIGAALVDLAPATLSTQATKDDTAQAASESLVPAIAISGSMESAARKPAQKRRTLSSPQARESLSALELNENDDSDRKPRPRLVSVIH
jgi:hypothetical protein